MSIDVGYHAVNLDLLKNDLIPYIMRQKSALSSIDHSARIVINRYIANDIGGQLLDIKNHCSSFNADLHIWGRPFFVTQTTPASMITTIDAYLAATNEQAAQITAQEINFLQPGLFNHLDSTQFSLPNYDVKADIISNIDRLREAYTCLRSGKPYEMPENGEKLDPAEVIKGNLFYCLMRYAASSSPSWMARGYLWPTYLIADCHLQTDLVTTLADTCAEIITVIPQLRERIAPTIKENYFIGGVVLPHNVAKFREFLQTHKKTLITKAAQNEELAYVELAFQKLDECLLYAASKNLAFIESSDVVSGIEGRPS